MVRAQEGGASIYVDGFAVAERLRATNPEAFEFFSRTSISYQCFDEGCHYMAEGPVFRLGPHGEVVQVRENIEGCTLRFLTALHPLPSLVRCLVNVVGTARYATTDTHTPSPPRGILSGWDPVV